MDGGEKRSYQPKMKRPEQLLRGKRPIMANPPVNKLYSDAISNQPGLSFSTDSHFSKNLHLKRDRKQGPTTERLLEMNFIVTVEVRRRTGNYTTEMRQKSSCHQLFPWAKDTNLLFFHKPEPLNCQYLLISSYDKSKSFHQYINNIWKISIGSITLLAIARNSKHLFGSWQKMDFFLYLFFFYKNATKWKFTY